jgi:hypothetical protein
VSEVNYDITSKYSAIYNGRGPGVDYKLGIAFSDSLVGPWQVDVQRPLIDPPDGYDQLVKPSIISVGKLFYMYAQAMNFYNLNGRSEPDIFLYVSKDGVNWVLNSNEPVLRSASRPTILYDPSDKGSEFKLWYRAHGASNISYAFSNDGIQFQALGVVLDNGPIGSFDALNASPGAILKKDGIYHLYYEAADDNLFFSGGEASFFDPKGPYFKNPLNPILKRESSASASLLTTVDKGSRIIKVADSTVFKVNQPLIIFDSTARWELVRPEKIVDGMTIIIGSPLLQKYELASQATIRSWAFAKVYISHVEFYNGRWYAFSTAFDPYKGIASGPLEMTGLATGLELNSLQWDYSYSPLFPITSSMDNTWSGYSRENPTIFKVQLN